MSKYNQNQFADVFLTEDYFTNKNMQGCGGASAQETAAQESEAAFNSELQGQYATRFGEQSDVLNQLTEALNPLVAAGPNQQGYSASELAALNTQAVQGVGANYANAARAVQNQEAGQGGGAGTGLTSGVDKQVNSAIASSAAGQTSNEELGITQADYATGRQNFQSGIEALSGVAQQENPVGIGQLNNQANSSQFNEANTINTENQAWEGQLIGGITGLAGGVLGGITGGFGGGVSGSPDASLGIDSSVGSMSGQPGESSQFFPSPMPLPPAS